MFFSSPMDSFMFRIFPILFSVVFVIILGVIIMNIFKGIGQWKYNNAQPTLTVAAKVVTKRTNVSRSIQHHTDHTMHHHTSTTTYYVTFEVESGDRMEFLVKDREYGMLVEDDRGLLTFQGTRYLGFKRNIN